MVTRRITDKQETEQLRGWIVYLLYLSKPKPLELNALWTTLDMYSIPTVHRKFVEEVDHLRALGLLRIFPAGAKTEIDEIEQARLLQKFIDGPRARELGTFVFARLTTAGVQFQEGDSEAVGVARVE
jgi:hypothetical protein